MSEPIHRATRFAVLPLVLSSLAALALPPAAAATGQAGVPSLQDPWDVTFVLERIRVDGLRNARGELLLAEARLEAGGSYSEEELGRAIDRIRRLLFVREATFRLEKGSRRGLYELVITVEETRRTFFGVHLVSSEGDDGFTFDVDDLDEDDESGLLVGLRFFAGRTGTFFVAAEESGLAVGYAQSRLWGRPGSLRVGYEQSHDEPSSQTFGASVDPGFGPWTLEDSRTLTVGVDFPLGAAESWGLELEHREADGGSRRLGPLQDSTLRLEDFADDRLTASWLRDTTDDAIFAERGVRQVVAVSYRQVAAAMAQALMLDEVLPIDFESESMRLSFLRSRWWTPIDRHTVWGSVDVAFATTRIEELAIASDDQTQGPVALVPNVSFDSAELAAIAGHRFRMFAGRRDERTGIPQGAFREIYWETSFKASRDEAFGDLVGGVFLQFEARTGIVWRTSWGIFRVGLRFVDSEQNS